MSLEDVNHRRRAFNDETLQTATMHKLLWDGTDILYLEQHIHNPTEETAIDLGRTYEAVQSKRLDLRIKKVRDLRKKDGKELDKPLTLDEACSKREELLKQGIQYPTVMPVSGGYIVIEGRATNDID